MKLPLTLITLVSFTVPCSIVAMNADIDEQALTEAVKSKKYDQVKWLLENGAKINCVDTDGDTPLHLACLAFRKDVVKLLIEHKADTNYSNKNGITPLHSAAMDKSKEIVEILLNNGALASINAKTKEGSTPLVYAALFDQLEIVKLLLEKGADATWESKTGLRFYHYATDAAIRSSMQQLYKKYAFPNYGSDAIDELLK